MPVFIAGLAGYVAGTILALTLDRLYTGAPLRGPLGFCAHGHTSHAVWAGTAGFLLMRGRCPSGCRLPARLWYLPLLGAAAAVAIALRAVDARHAILLALFSTFLTALVGTDFERHLLPNRLMYPALGLAVALGWAWPGRTWLGSLEGGGLGFLVMLTAFVIFPNFGFGDVKLSALLGLLAGISHTLPALTIGILAGGIGAVFMLATRQAGRKSLMAYGPYLALGAFSGMLLAAAR
ncbi:MAG TPA: A24 family peptidase [Dehalococcoidia bacterium]|nr:A24 family peptidase [Dehalococcoidia bacterium]